MTDRVNALTVVLEQDIREDDADALISAISQLRGVAKVGVNISDASDYVAQQRARQELHEKLWAVIYPNDPA